MPAGDTTLRCSGNRQQGFTLLALLATLTTVSVGLAVAGPRWAERAQRDKEQELLKVGTLYAEAIASYHRASPGSVKRYPRQLSDLLEDSRFVGMRRHLREIYPDPLAPDKPWGLVAAPDGGIRGVYSQSTAAPQHQAPMDLGVVVLPQAQRYSDWQFAPREIP